jgi:hypothetical protein
MLDLPHIIPLAEYCRCLRAEGRGTVPEFDPRDGGVAAKVLFLMEKPGPVTDDNGLTGRIGSGGAVCLTTRLSHNVGGWPSNGP